MDKPTTMTVEQGKCTIYPEQQLQMCVRVKVLVMQLKPGATPDAEWIAEEGRLRDVELRCGMKGGLDRLLRAIDNATKPPTPRPRKATDAKGAGGA